MGPFSYLPPLLSFVLLILLFTLLDIYIFGMAIALLLSYKMHIIPFDSIFLCVNICINL